MVQAVCITSLIMPTAVAVVICVQDLCVQICAVTAVAVVVNER
jgi:hypothetical protein